MTLIRRFDHSLGAARRIAWRGQRGRIAGEVSRVRADLRVADRNPGDVVIAPVERRLERRAKDRPFLSPDARLPAILRGGLKNAETILDKINTHN